MTSANQSVTRCQRAARRVVTLWKEGGDDDEIWQEVHSAHVGPAWIPEPGDVVVARPLPVTAEVPKRSPWLTKPKHVPLFRGLIAAAAVVVAVAVAIVWGAGAPPLGTGDRV